MKNMKYISKKTAGIAAAVIVVVIAAALVAVNVMKVSPVEAEQIALNQAGGGEIVESEISNEGLWNEYSYTVVNGDSWYKVDITGFGNIEEMESGSGDSWRY